MIRAARRTADRRGPRGVHAGGVSRFWIYDLRFWITMDNESERAMTTTANEAGRVVAGANIAHKRELARQSAGRINGDAIVQTQDIASQPTPLVGRAPLETIPDLPAAIDDRDGQHDYRPGYRGRQITISNDGMTLDQFCDLLDKRLGVAS